MGLDQAVRRFRSRQRRLFRDEGTITRPSGTSTFNPVTGLEAPDPGDAIYSGVLQVRPASERSGRDAQAGEREIRLGGLILKLPVDTPIDVDDELTLTVSRYDADLVGRTFRITDVLRDGRQIARVAVLEEVT